MRAAPALLCLSLLAVGATAYADDAKCISASEAGLALKQQGKLRDALRELSTCATSTCPTEVAAECSKRIGTINAAVPTLILGVKDPAGNDVVAAKVTLDGAEAKDALLGRPLALDPGEHTVTVQADGFPLATKTLLLRQGEKDRRETIVLTATPAPPPPPPRPTWNKWRTLAVLTGGVGLVGLGLGAAFGAYASSSQSREKADCALGACKNYPQGMEDYSVASKDANASTGALVAGGVLVAAGVVLWFTTPKPGAEAPPAVGLRSVTITPSAGARTPSVAVRGTF